MEYQYNSLRSHKRGRQPDSIRDNAQNFKSLSNKRKYTMRPESRERIMSPRSIESDSRYNPYMHYLNKRLSNDVRSVENEDPRPIKDGQNRGYQTLNIHQMKRMRSPKFTHNVWSDTSAYESEGSKTFKSTGNVKSRSNSSKNKKYFSFKNSRKSENHQDKENRHENYQDYYQGIFIMHI